jgi:cytochrome c peroxidase
MRRVVASLSVIVLVGAALVGRADDASTVELGRRLFFDPTIGRRGVLACAHCHDDEHGFASTDALSEDEGGLSTEFHAPTLIDLGDGPFGWTGRFETLREAIDEHRLLEPSKAREAAVDRATARVLAMKAGGRPVDRRLVTSFEESLTLLRGDSRLITPPADRVTEEHLYDAGFRAAFGDAKVTRERIVDALAAFVRSLRSSENPYDRFAAGDTTALSPAARRGFELFAGKAACATCHSTTPSGGRAAFTDRAFHDMSGDRAAIGRALFSFLESDRGKFRTPSLRDVARRAPYFHDGSAATLAEAIDVHERRAVSHALSRDDVADLVAFLDSLTGDSPAGLPPATPRNVVAVHVERLDGTPDSWIRLRIDPYGQLIGGTVPEAFDVSADENGDARFTFPATTHAVISASDATVGLLRPMPDWTTSATLVTTRPDKASIRLWHAATPKAQIEVRRSEPRRPATPREYGVPSDDGPRLRVCADQFDFQKGPYRASLVRVLPDGVALYSVPASDGEDVGRRWLFAPPAQQGPFELDLSRGAANSIDWERSEPADAGPLSFRSPAVRRLEDALDPAPAKPK